ncbi:MAG: hypothetical protein ACKERG_04060 [Candidatus Hodgkinia cicadicola]
MLRFVWVWGRRWLLSCNLLKSMLWRDCAAGRKSLSSDVGQLQVGIAGCARFVVESWVDELAVFADNLASVLIEWSCPDATAQIVLASAANVKARFVAAGALVLNVAVGSNSSFELVFVESFKSFDVDVDVRLACFSCVLVAASCLSASGATSWRVNAVVLGKRADVKLVYNVLALNRNALRIGPSFALRNSAAACVHSVSVRGSLHGEGVYLANRQLRALAAGALLAYAVCTVGSD